MRSWARLAIVALASAEAGWMAFDGVRALITGDYVTLQDGRLGPWADLVALIGIEPRSVGMKLLFAAYGLTWLALIPAFMARRTWSNRAMAGAAAGALWYLPVGTLFSIVQLALHWRGVDDRTAT